MNKTEKEIESMLDFKFEFELDLFYVKRFKKWLRKLTKRSDKKNAERISRLL